MCATSLRKEETHMKNFDIPCDVPDGYSGPELVIVTKNPKNHKARFRRATAKNAGYDKIYLAESVLKKCKYFYEPSDGLTMYWSNPDELKEMFGYIVSNPFIWETDVSEDDASLLVVESFDENVHWEER